MYCPKCGSVCITEHVKQVAYVVNYYGSTVRPPKSEVEDFGEVLEVIEKECQSCGHYSADPDEKWNRMPSEVQRDELLDWADNYNDDRRLGLR